MSRCILSTQFRHQIVLRCQRRTKSHDYLVFLISSSRSSPPDLVRNSIRVGHTPRLPTDIYKDQTTSSSWKSLDVDWSACGRLGTWLQIFDHLWFFLCTLWSAPWSQPDRHPSQYMREIFLDVFLNQTGRLSQLDGRPSRQQFLHKLYLTKAASQSGLDIMIMGDVGVDIIPEHVHYSWRSWWFPPRRLSWTSCREITIPSAAMASPWRTCRLPQPRCCTNPWSGQDDHQDDHHPRSWDAWRYHPRGAHCGGTPLSQDPVLERFL
jgi:hypothetical protein